MVTLVIHLSLSGSLTYVKWKNCVSCANITQHVLRGADKLGLSTRWNFFSGPEGSFNLEATLCFFSFHFFSLFTDKICPKNWIIWAANLTILHKNVKIKKHVFSDTNRLNNKEWKNISDLLIHILAFPICKTSFSETCQQPGETKIANAEANASTLKTLVLMLIIRLRILLFEFWKFHTFYGIFHVLDAIFYIFLTTFTFFLGKYTLN